MPKMFACMVAAALTVSVSALPAVPVPALFWSAGDHLGAKNTHNGALDGAHLVDYVRSVMATEPRPLAESNPLPAAAAAAPEVMLGLVLDQLRTDELSTMAGAHAAGSPEGGVFSALKAAVEGASSSLVAPHTTRAPGAPSLVDALLSSVSGARAVQPAELLSTLGAGAELLADGRPDLVLVQVPRAAAEGGMAGVNALLEEATRLLHRGTSGNYVAFVTANGGGAPLPEVEIQLPQQHEQHRRHGRALLADAPAVAAAADIGYTNQLHMTPAIISGLMLAFFLSFVLLVATCCMMDIPSAGHMLQEPPEQDQSSQAGIKYYPYKNLPIKEY